jgi:hypothetical protein
MNPKMDEIGLGHGCSRTGQFRAGTGSGAAPLIPQAPRSSNTMLRYAPRYPQDVEENFGQHQNVRPSCRHHPDYPGDLGMTMDAPDKPGHDECGSRGVAPYA